MKSMDNLHFIASLSLQLRVRPECAINYAFMSEMGIFQQ